MSYIQDTKDFLRDIEGLPIPVDAVLVAMDVVSQYSIIPHDEVIQMVECVLELH